MSFFSVHLLDVFKDHVAMPIERLDARQQLAVVAAGDQDLCVAAHGRLQDRQGPGRELVLFQEGDFVLAAGC